MTLKIKTAAEIELIGKLRAERYSCRAIAERFGVHATTIYDICRKNGFKPNKFPDECLQSELGKA